MSGATERENVDAAMKGKATEVTEGVKKVLENLIPEILKGGKTGSGVNQLRDQLGGWESGTIEQQFRDRFQQIGRRVSSIQVPPIVNSYIDSGKNYASEHPYKATAVGALALTCAIPIISFVTFALTTLLVTFTGFLFIEGTILGIAASVLAAVVLVVGGITLSIVSCVLVGVFIFAKVYTLITGDRNPQRVLRKLPYVGQYFANFQQSGINGEAPKISNGVEDQDGNESLAHTD